MQRWNLPADWEWRPLCDVCEINPRRPQLVRSSEVPTSFIPMDTVDEKEGKVVEVKNRPYQEVRSGYTYFEENDVLFAKITPSMENGKVAIARNLIDGFGFGTTEFHVFRSRKLEENLVQEASPLPEWIFYYIRRIAFRDEAKQHFRGAVGQQRVPEDFLKSYPIPIPYSRSPERSKSIQRQIVARIEAMLSEVREMREINQKIIEDTKQLLGAFLNQIFENSPGKEYKTIDEVGFVKGGKRLPKGESFAAQPTSYPYLRVTDFRNFSIDESGLRYLTPGVHAQIRNYIISDQDVYISIAGTIGLVGTVPAHLSGGNLTENAAKIVFRPEYQGKIKNKYLMYYLASPQGKKQIEARTKAAGQPKLALERIKTITFPYIDSLTQQESIIEKIEAVQSEITEMLRTQQVDEKFINQLEESILSQAFQGKL